MKSFSSSKSKMGRGCSVTPAPNNITPFLRKRKELEFRYWPHKLAQVSGKLSPSFLNLRWGMGYKPYLNKASCLRTVFLRQQGTLLTIIAPFRYLLVSTWERRLWSWRGGVQPCLSVRSTFRYACSEDSKIRRQRYSEHPIRITYNTTIRKDHRPT